MVDQEQQHQPRRHRGGGGGGGGGGGYNRKRRYREDDGFDRHRQQRRRYEEPLHVMVRRQMLTIAESAARRAEDDVARIAKTVADNYEDENLRTSFQELVLQLIIEQPLKIPFVASTVLVLNSRKPEATAAILAKAGEHTASYVTEGEWRNVKLMLRFFGCLQGILEGEGVFPMLEELFSRAVDLQTASSEDSLGLELVKVILYTIPYVMASSASGFESKAAALLEKTDIIASTPHTLEALVDPFPSEEGQDGDRVSALGLLQKQLLDEARDRWKLLCIPRPWKDLPKEKKQTNGEEQQQKPQDQEQDQQDGEGKEDQPAQEQPQKAEGEEEEEVDLLKDATKHTFPAITVPNPVKNGPRAIFPEIYLSVYANQDIDTVPSTSEVASSLVRDALVDTINGLHFNRIATAKFLIDVDCFFAPNTFVKRAVPVDKLRDTTDENRSTWKPEDVAVDAVFSQLFQLPTPDHKMVYYHSVLTESCKIAPAAIAPSLGRAIRFLYRNVETLDLSLVNRFLDWFSHHLSNFGFTWKWTEWVDDVELPDVHPKKAFIIGALDKEIRLSFAQRIKGTLPKPYHFLITEGKEKDTPDFKYADEATPYSNEGRELMQLVRKKAPDEEIGKVIKSIEEQAAAHGLPDPLVASTDAFVTSICFVGSKSLSHFLSCIERCKDRLLGIGPKSAIARRQIITSVMEYWTDQPGIAINIIDKLLNYTILTPLSVLEWALVDNLAGGSKLAYPPIFEMISATIGKVTNRMRQIVAARTQPALVEPQLTVVHDTLVREREDMKSMFKLIEDSLVSVAAGSNDQMIERADDPALQPENDIIREWGKRWLRVFRRKAAVEEAFIDEAMTVAPALGTMAPPPPVVQPTTVEAEMTTVADEGATSFNAAPAADGMDDIAEIE